MAVYVGLIHSLIKIDYRRLKSNKKRKADDENAVAKVHDLHELLQQLK